MSYEQVVGTLGAHALEPPCWLKRHRRSVKGDRPISAELAKGRSRTGHQKRTLRSAKVALLALSETNFRGRLPNAALCKTRIHLARRSLLIAHGRTGAYLAGLSVLAPDILTPGVSPNPAPLPSRRGSPISTVHVNGFVLNCAPPKSGTTVRAPSSRHQWGSGGRAPPGVHRLEPGGGVRASV
jgi:hypothetical protein